MRWFQLWSALLAIALPGSAVFLPVWLPAAPARAQIFPDLSSPFAQRILWAEALLKAGLVQDGLAVYEREIEQIHAEGDRRREAEFIQGLGANFQEQGRLDLALNYYERARSVFAGDSGASPFVIHDLARAIGALYRYQGQWEQARETYQQALKATANSNEIWSQGNTFQALGLVDQNQGQWELALEAYQQALRVYEATDDYEEPETATTLTSIGLIREAQGDTAAAIASYQQARQQAANLEEAIPRIAYQVLALERLQQLAIEQGDSAQAETYAQQAADLMQPAPPGYIDPSNPGHLGLAMGWLEVGKFYLALQEVEEAGKAFDRAVATVRESINQGYDALSVITSIATACTEVQQPALALPYQQQAIAILEAMGLAENTAATLQRLGDLQFQAGQATAALATYQQTLAAHAAAQQMFASDQTNDFATVFQKMAAVYSQQGDWPQASQAYQQALALYQEAGNALGQVAVLEQWAALAAARDPELARSLQQQAESLRQGEPFRGMNF